MIEKCNSFLDCPDHSDEISCDFILFAPSSPYVTRVMQLNVSIEINRILSIDYNEGIFEATFKVKIEWTDERVAFKDLNEDPNQNVLKQRKLYSEDRFTLWTPQLELKTIKETINDGLIYLIWKNQRTEFHRVEGSQCAIIQGKDVVVVKHHTFTGKFPCDFDLKMFPFDVQHCFINMSLIHTQMLKTVRLANS